MPFVLLGQSALCIQGTANYDQELLVRKSLVRLWQTTVANFLNFSKSLLSIQYRIMHFIKKGVYWLSSKLSFTADGNKVLWEMFLL